EEPLLQLTDREAARVDDLVGQVACPRQPALLLPDAALHATMLLKGMAVARLAEARDETRLGCLEVEHVERDLSAGERGACPLDRGRRIAGTDVEHECDVPIARLIGVPEVEEAVEQLRRQVVDAVEA